MRVGIVGAGVSGLGAARDLHDHGHDVVVFDRNPAPGGRCATRREAGFVWDTGATSVAPRGKRIGEVMLHYLDPEELVRVQKPIFVHSNLRVSPGDPRKNVERYVVRSGIDTLAAALGRDLDVRLGTVVDAIVRDHDRFEMADETFDAVVITAPAPQTSLLLWSVGESRPIAGARYRSSLSVTLGYDRAAPDTPYWAVIDQDQRHPMIWLSLESTKSPGRAPEGGCAMTVQMSPAFSADYFDRPSDWIAAVAIDFVGELYGDAFTCPVVSNVTRWKYAHSESLASFDVVNPKGSRIVLAGDAFAGGRVEDAYESGVHASELLRATG